MCSDAAAEAARYGFTAVDRREGFLILAVVSLGEKMIEISALPEVPPSAALHLMLWASLSSGRRQRP